MKIEAADMGGAWYTVFLDGVEQKDAVLADDTAGYVGIHARDAQGRFRCTILESKPCLSYQDAVIEIKTGKVEIRPGVGSPFHCPHCQALMRPVRERCPACERLIS